MATGAVTKSNVDALQPGERDQFLWDNKLRGFGVKVTPGGNKVFILQYRMGGRGSPTKRYTIGTYGSPWTPADARAEAERLLIRVRQGGNPADEKRERLRVATDLAFSAYADRFLKEYVKREWARSYDDAERVLRLHIRPALRDKPLPSIRMADITALLDRLPTSQAALRAKVFAIVRRLFRWAKGRGDIESNPIEGFEAPPAPPSRDRVLADCELRLAWLAAGDLGYPFGGYYRSLALTGQRREEVAGMDWKELNRDAAQWRLPAERAKNGRATVIHLSAPMIAELDAIAGGEKWPRRGLVFTTNGKTSISGYSRAKRRLDAAMLKLGRKEAEKAGDDPELVEIAPWRVHDFRRTSSTGMQGLGIRWEVIEACHNRSMQGVSGVYQRHDLSSETRDAFNAWAAHIQRLASGVDQTNVIQLAEARA